MKKLFLLLLCVSFCTPVFAAEPTTPNVIYLMLDEWGYFESGHMGNRDLITPNIDRFAREGMRFTNAYAGAPVCGPTRCVLLTGLHSGHTSMRINDGFSPIREDEPTLASMLKQRGYATGGFGKWGIGGRGTSGVPENHGFDEFFGYYDQVHAHTFYPRYLIRNSREVPLKGNKGVSFYEGETHAQVEIFNESIKFIRSNKDTPFFCYLPWTPPHGLWGIDDDDPSWQLFKDKPWTAGQRTENDAKVYAAFMHMVDRQIGEIITLLEELDLDDNTVFFLCGDNGGQDYFKTKERPHGFFAPNLNPKTGERFRAGKGSLYEGGLKVPYLVRWPGKIKPGTVSDHLLCYQDVMPTLAEMTKTTCPETDGLSFLPTLIGKPDQPQHTYLYWEYAAQVAVRMQDWKAYKGKRGDWELYDLSSDVEEKNDIAADNPTVVKRLVSLAAEAHQPIRPGTIYNRELTEKDHRQAPHERNLKLLKTDHERPAMKPFWFILALLSSCLVTSGEDRPNIILCMTDDQGWGDVGYNGHPHLKTPHLDQIAAEGVTFTRFYSAAAMCSPTRASCYTGRNPYRFGVTFAMKGMLEPTEIPITTVLKQHGYTTGHFGKWHLGTLSRKAGDQKRWGAFAAHPERYYCPPWERDVDVCFVTESKVPTWDPLVDPGPIKKGDSKKSANREQTYGNDYFTGPGRTATENTRGDDSRVIMDRAIPFIQDAVKKDQPFFAAVWFHTPHSPVVGGPKYRAMYRDQPEPAQHYYACLTAMDEQVGRMRAELEALGIADNTMLCFCSDNGPARQGSPRHVGTAQHLKGFKLSINEGGIRVPGLMVWPDKARKPRTIDAPCFTSDYFPTILDALGIELPQDRIYDGVSLLPYVTGEQTEREKPLGFLNRDGKESVWMEQRYKFISTKKGDELYDMVADPGESRNLAEKMPEVAQRMKAELTDWKAEVMAELDQLP